MEDSPKVQPEFGILGKVYLVKHRISRRLEGAYFSTADFKFYNTKCEPMPEMWSRYNHRPFELHFNVGPLKSPTTGELVVDVKGRIKGLKTIADFPPRPYLTTKNVNDAQEKINAWMAELGLLEEQRGLRVNMSTVLEDNCPVLTIASIPDISPEKLKIHLLYGIFVHNFDDILDPSLKVDVGKELDVFEAYCDIMEGKAEVADHEERLAGAYPFFAATGRVIAAMRDEAYKVGAETGADPSYYLAAFSDYLRTTLWEDADSKPCGIPPWDHKEPRYLTRCHWHKRNVTVGSPVQVELIALYRGINIPPIVRKNPLFTYINWLMDQYVAVINDIFSLTKEFKAGQFDNYMVVPRNGVAIQDVFNEALVIINDCVVCFTEATKRLLKFFPNDKNVKRFVELGEGWIATQWQLYSLTVRYGVKPFDCHIFID